MTALVKRLLVVVRWAQWEIPLVGACSKLRGEIKTTSIAAARRTKKQ